MASDGVTLAGTLRLPEGPGPFPIAVTISGSGTQPRGGFRLLNAHLLTRGIATFEYDKRGSGVSAGALVELVPMLAGDLKAAVAMLRQRSVIVPTRVALVGGRQGRAVAPATAVADPLIKRVVMLTGAVMDGESLFRSQVLPQIQALSADPAQRYRRSALSNRILTVIEAAEDDGLRRTRL